jgi:hypothetical protein
MKAVYVFLQFCVVTVKIQSVQFEFSTLRVHYVSFTEILENMFSVCLRFVALCV